MSDARSARDRLAEWLASILLHDSATDYDTGEQARNAADQWVQDDDGLADEYDRLRAAGEALARVEAEHADCPVYCDDCLRWELPRSCIWCKGEGCEACAGTGRRHDHDEFVPRLIDALADCVTKAAPYGRQNSEFVATYILPTGPIHRAIPLLQELRVTVRPGFDGRGAARKQ